MKAKNLSLKTNVCESDGSLNLDLHKHSITLLKSPSDYESDQKDSNPQVKAKAKKLGGVFSGEVPPDSIPNSEVKLASGENSAEVARCQNSTMPPFSSH